jgi:hypothetical protein
MKTAFIICTVQRYHYYNGNKEGETGKGEGYALCTWKRQNVGRENFDWKT